MKKLLTKIMAAAIIFSLIPTVNANAKVTPVNAQNLTASYKSKLAKQRKNTIKVSAGNYASRTKAQEKALIDITWNELKNNSQIRLTRKGFDLMCRVVSCEVGNTKYTTKEMAAECVVNRARSYKSKADPLTSALTAPNQFSVVRSSRINNWDLNGETVNACKDALIKNSHPKTLKYFRAGHYFSTSWCKPYKAQDNSYFSLSKY